MSDDTTNLELEAKERADLWLVWQYLLNEGGIITANTVTLGQGGGMEFRTNDWYSEWTHKDHALNQAAEWIRKHTFVQTHSLYKEGK